MRAIAVAVLALVLAGGCVKNYTTPTSPDPVVVPPPVAIVPHTIEFRALGTVTRAHLTYGSAQDGTTEWNGDLPWSASFTTRRSSLFVYCYGEALSFGEIRVQIFVDGELFREASSSDFGTAQASGTLQLSN
jgi:hypothetical protein